jgi:hypothetical protein
MTITFDITFYEFAHRVKNFLILILVVYYKIIIKELELLPFTCMPRRGGSEKTPLRVTYEWFYVMNKYGYDFSAIRIVRSTQSSLVTLSWSHNRQFHWMVHN